MILTLTCPWSWPSPVHDLDPHLSMTSLNWNSMPSFMSRGFRRMAFAILDSTLRIESVHEQESPTKVVFALQIFVRNKVSTSAWLPVAHALLLLTADSDLNDPVLVGGESLEQLRNRVRGNPEPWTDKIHRRQWKMSSSKKWTCKGTSRQVFIWLRPRIPYTPLTHCIRVYSMYIHYSHREGVGGGGVELNQREGATVHKARSKIQHDWLYLQSINYDKHLPQSPFIGQFF